MFHCCIAIIIHTVKLVLGLFKYIMQFLLYKFRPILKISLKSKRKGKILRSNPAYLPEPISFEIEKLQFGYLAQLILSDSLSDVSPKRG